MDMSLTLAVISLVVIGLLVVMRIKARRVRQEMEKHCITAEELHALLGAHQEVLLFDVRRPLDMFANSEVIPGARRIAPQDWLRNPSLIPKEKDSIIYCTCPGEETSRKVLRLALGMGFNRVKFLKGGLEAWKAKGYPLKPYVDPIHLETAT
jgi:rhodanese-related sulfurtransferase